MILKSFRFVSASVLMLSMVLMSGCLSGYAEHLRRTDEQGWSTSTQTKYTVDNYKVLGIVKVTTSSTSLLGIVISGEEGSGLLWDVALAKYGESVKNIKDIKVSYKNVGFLPPFFNKIEATYVGVAVDK